MPVEVSQHAQFGQRMAKYNADKGAATQAGDDVALARADAEWANARMEMERDLYARAEEERSRQGEIARIKTENPNVPASVFESIPDLTQAEKVAKELQAAHGTTTMGQQGTWSPSPTGGTGAQPVPADFVDPNEQRDWFTGTLPSQQKKMNSLIGDTMRGNRQAAEEIMHVSLEPLRAGAHRERRFPPKS